MVAFLRAFSAQNRPGDHPARFTGKWWVGLAFLLAQHDGRFLLCDLSGYVCRVVVVVAGCTSRMGSPESEAREMANSAAWIMADHANDGGFRIGRVGF